jgi:hypothetical protein
MDIAAAFLDSFMKPPGKRAEEKNKKAQKPKKRLTTFMRCVN